MANNYTGYSFTVPVPGRAEELVAKFAEHDDWEPENEGDTHPLGIELDDYQSASCVGEVEVEDADTVAIYYDGDGGDLHVAAAVTQWLLRETGSSEEVVFSWAVWCSKPLTDEFGGGIVAVTADGYMVWDGYGLYDQLRKAQRPEPVIAFGDDTPLGDLVHRTIPEGYVISLDCNPPRPELAEQAAFLTAGDDGITVAPLDEECDPDKPAGPPVTVPWLEVKTVMVY